MSIFTTLALAGAAACPVAAKGTDPAALYAQAEATIKAGRMGEHLRQDAADKAVALLRQAARAGHLQAQFRLGSMVFSSLYQSQGPTPAQQAEYTEALTWLSTAMRRGHARARGYLPPHVALALRGAPPPKPDPDAPMTDLPKAWIDAAAAQGQAWSRCWPCQPTDGPGLALCADQKSVVSVAPVPPGQLTNHPVLAGPGQQQGYGQVGDAQVLLIGAALPKCAGHTRVTGTVRAVEAKRGPATYRNAAIYVDLAACE